MSAVNSGPEPNTYLNKTHPYVKSIPKGWKVEEKTIKANDPIPSGWSLVPGRRDLRTKRVWKLVLGKRKPVTKKNINALANRLRNANFETGWRWQNSPAAAAAPAPPPAGSPPNTNMLVNETFNANLNALTGRVGRMNVANMEENVENWRAPTGGRRKHRATRKDRRRRRARTVRRH